MYSLRTLLFTFNSVTGSNIVLDDLNNIEKLHVRFFCSLMS